MPPCTRTPSGGEGGITATAVLVLKSTRSTTELSHTYTHTHTQRHTDHEHPAHALPLVQSRYCRVMVHRRRRPPSAPAPAPTLACIASCMAVAGSQLACAKTLAAAGLSSHVAISTRSATALSLASAAALPARGLGAAFPTTIGAADAAAGAASPRLRPAPLCALKTLRSASALFFNELSTL